MDGFLPVLAAVATTIGTIIAGVFASRRLAKFGLTTEQLRVTATLRELAEVATQKALLQEQRLAELQAKLTDTQHDLDDCSRQRDNAYAELRGVRRRTPPAR